MSLACAKSRQMQRKGGASEATTDNSNHWQIRRCRHFRLQNQVQETRMTTTVFSRWSCDGKSDRSLFLPKARIFTP
jgi:hypothetical protein